MNRELIVIAVALALMASLLAAAGIGVAVLLHRPSPAQIVLPESVLATPPERAKIIVVQVLGDDHIRVGNHEGSLAQLVSFLEEEVANRDDVSADELTINIRAAPEVLTRTVQQIIQTCQEAGFENFELRAKSK